MSSLLGEMQSILVISSIDGLTNAEQSFLQWASECIAKVRGYDRPAKKETRRKQNTRFSKAVSLISTRYPMSFSCRSSDLKVSQADGPLQWVLR
jgi:hypothetical protein